MAEIIVKGADCVLTITKYVIQLNDIGELKVSDAELGIRFHYQFKDGVSEYNSMGLKRATALAGLMNITYLDWVNLLAAEAEVLHCGD